MHVKDTALAVSVFFQYASNLVVLQLFPLLTHLFGVATVCMPELCSARPILSTRTMQSASRSVNPSAAYRSLCCLIRHN